MKILIADDSQGSSAWTYIRLGLAKAFMGSGYNVAIWDTRKPAIDVLDAFEPDILIAQTYNLERGIITAITERPNLKVILQGSDWSDYSDNIDNEKYPILRANNKEVKTVENLNKTHPIEFIYCHYHENNVNKTHHHWKDKLGINIRSSALASDIDDYTNGISYDDFKSDIVFVGGYWSYKSQIINNWFFPLCEENLNLKIRVFGNKNWPIHQYCGYIDTGLVKHMMKSAKLTVNLSEPHAHTVGGHDINERVFKLLSNKCPVISDYTQSFAEDFFPDGEVIFAKTPKDFKEKCLGFLNGEFTIDIQKGYDLVMSEHTYFQRAAEIFSNLGMENESLNILNRYEQIRKDNNL